LAQVRVPVRAAEVWAQVSVPVRAAEVWARVSVSVPVQAAEVWAQVPVPARAAEVWVAKAAGLVKALAPGLEEEAAVGAGVPPPGSPASERR